MNETEVVQDREAPTVGFKARRGGKRLGAGRKPNYFKRLAVKPITAAEILARYDEPKVWDYFLKHPDPRIALQARQYLTDRRDCKAKQAVDVSGRNPARPYRISKSVGRFAVARGNPSA